MATRVKKRQLGYVSDFIRMIKANLSPGHIDRFEGIYFSKENEGWIWLTSSEAREYRSVLSRLVDQYVKHDEMSQRTVEQFFQDAIFHALDIRSQRKASFDEGLDEAVEALHRQLIAKPSTYTCFITIEGIESGELPRSLGRLRLVVFSKAQLQKIFRTPGAKRLSPEYVDFQKKVMREGECWQRPCAVINVEAKDYESANNLAHRETQAILDIINFFTDLLRFNHGWLYLPGGEAKAISATPIVKCGGESITVNLQRTGPLLPFSLKKLREDIHLRRQFLAVNRLLRSGPKNEIEKLLITAIQWAGRATVETRREQQFLLFAIALESLMLPEKEPRELSYRLRIRVAHLLGKNQEERREIKKTVADLYVIRSKIVHNGSYEVGDESLGELRAIVKSAILRLLTHRAVRSLQDRKQLAEWFENGIYR